MLYHGTVFEGLTVIKANTKSHTTGRMVAYFTEDRCYALVCCRKKSEDFVTMGLNKDGKQHYYERFPDQLRVLYEGKRGYIYENETSSTLINTKGHTWESEADVPAHLHEVVEDVYAEILKEEQAGNIIIHRYADINPKKQKENANYLKEHMGDQGEEMRQFYLAHFSELWD